MKRKHTMLIMLAGILPLAAQAGEKSRWYACSNDAECVALSGICGPRAVNVNHQNSFKEWAEEESKTASCVSPYIMGNEPKSAVCKTNLCELVK